MSLRDLEIPGDHRQKVIKVVCDTPSELANGFHLLRLGELYTSLCKLATVFVENSLCAPPYRSIGCQHQGRNGDADGDNVGKQNRGLVNAAWGRRKDRAPK